MNNLKWKELPLDKIKQLKQMELPEKWKVSRVTVEFERPGTLSEWASVVYDNLNDVFFVKGYRGNTVYEEDYSVLNEAVGVMRKANRVIGGDK